MGVGAVVARVRKPLGVGSANAKTPTTNKASDAITGGAKLRREGRSRRRSLGSLRYVILVVPMTFDGD
jgi:hypothetical protein